MSLDLFLLYVQVEDYQNILKLKVLTTCFYLIELFEGTERHMELVSLPHFLPLF